jgi:hypothetical protein
VSNFRRTPCYHPEISSHRSQIFVATGGGCVVIRHLRKSTCASPGNSSVPKGFHAIQSCKSCHRFGQSQSQKAKSFFRTGLNRPPTGRFLVLSMSRAPGPAPCRCQER